MLLTVLPAVLLLAAATAFQISSSGSDIGQTEQNPARSDKNAQAIELFCNLLFNEGEQWTRCAWSHSFPEIWKQPDNQEGFVMCSAHSEKDNSEECEDQGNLKQKYQNNDPSHNPWTQYDTDRLKHVVTPDYCALRITNPHANDTGIWKCHVNDNNPSGQTSALWAETEIFVANKSTVAITSPSHTDSNSVPLIEVDLSSGGVQIDAECKAEFGRPPPQVKWYIDEPSNLLDDSLSTARMDRRDAATVISSLHFTLDQQMLARYSVHEDNSYFSFSLGCLPDQGNYFTYKPEDVHNPAQVMVYGTSGSGRLQSSLVLLLLAAVMAARRLA